MSTFSEADLKAAIEQARIADRDANQRIMDEMTQESHSIISDLHSQLVQFSAIGNELQTTNQALQNTNQALETRNEELEEALEASEAKVEALQRELDKFTEQN